MPGPPITIGDAVNDWLAAKGAWQASNRQREQSEADTKTAETELRTKADILRRLLEDEGKNVPADLRILGE